MKHFIKTSLFYTCIAVVLSGFIFSSCGKSSSGGGAAVIANLWYQDSDGDGFGDPDVSISQQDKPDGYVDNPFDCDDSNDLISPMAYEHPDDGIDNNCNDKIDEGPQTTGIPDTGQTLSYTDTFGEDADYIIDAPSYTKLDANGTPLPDEAISWKMVRDNVTQLVWELKDAEGGGPNSNNLHDADNTYTWEEATSLFIQGLNDEAFGGQTDWRLPTIKELAYLVNSYTFSHCITQGYFPLNTNFNIWSSTPKVEPDTNAWYLTVAKGIPKSDEKTSQFSAWAVRCDKAADSEDPVCHDGSTPDFEKYASDIIIDNQTTLMWQKETAKKNDGEGMTFEEALVYCENLTLGGYTDWRLPSRNELTSLIRFDLDDPAEDPLFEDTESSYYWTSTTYIKTPSTDFTTGWGIDLSRGMQYFLNKTQRSWVKAVRGGSITNTRKWYRDVDGDGYGDAAVVEVLNIAFAQPAGYVANNTDCNDNDEEINPIAVEIPDDGIDQNCTGGIDMRTWYADSDQDGYGSMTVYQLSESQPEGYVLNNEDCNDSNFSVNPGMEEIADDGLDNDCNGFQSVSWYEDTDGDGYGNGLRISVGEEPPATGTYAANALDCNDSNPLVHPGLVEIIGDSLDSNCNGDDDDSSRHIVPDTGQTTIYTLSPGEDASYTINPQHYTKIASDGSELPSDAADWAVVRDDVTGLYWEIKSDINPSEPKTFAEARTYAAALDHGGFDDWRLPTVTELAGIANLDRSEPAIDPAYFKNVHDERYWTSTDSGSESTALAMDFTYSQSYLRNKTDTYRVLAVRQDPLETVGFIDNGDDTFTEILSGLTWINVASSANNWADSRQLWETATNAGYSDWRLPTENDVRSLMHVTEQNPTINLALVFDMLTLSSDFWTLTLSDDSDARAMTYSLDPGEFDSSLVTATTHQNMGVRGTRLGRFIDSGDPDTTADDGESTVFDRKTGLMWQKTNGNAGTPMAFNGALTFCDALEFGGYTDWRLPSRNELLSLLEASISDPDGYASVFPNSDAMYWTSSSSFSLPDFAWQIHFASDDIQLILGSYTTQNRIRAVRGGN